MMPSDATTARANLRSTCGLVRSDIDARIAFDGTVPRRIGRLAMLLFPPVLGIVLYRFSHWLYCAHFRAAAWLLWVLQQMLTGMDISPDTQAGPRLVIAHAAGVTIAARLGGNVTIHGRCAIGGRANGRDADPARNGLPIVEDDVVIGPGAQILGALRIGAGAVIAAGSLVMSDVPSGMAAIGIPAVIGSPDTIAWSSAARPELT